MTDLFVLVHSPLVGPMTWEPVAEALRQRRRQVIVPELAHAPPPAQPHWRGHAASLAQAMRTALGGAAGVSPHAASMSPAAGGTSPRARARESPAAGRAAPHAPILVGHSGAGPLLPAVREACGGDVGGYLFVDAGLPSDGQTPAGPGGFHEQLRELYAGGERFPNWTDEQLRSIVPDEMMRRRLLDELRPQPWDYWVQRIAVFAGWPDAPCGYLWFTGSPAYAEPAAQARRAGWAYRELAGQHFHLLVDPEEVAEALQSLADEIRAGHFPQPG